MRDLGVLFDSELTMNKHMPRSQQCAFHIRRLRQICRRVGKDVTIRLVLALITPRLDLGLLQLGVRGPAAVNTRAVTESAV